MNRAEKFWNPYMAGIALGLVLLSSFLVMGKGLGASGAANRFGIAALNSIAPAHVAASPGMSDAVEGGRHPLDNWLVFEVLGVFLGGAVAAYTAGRMNWKVIRGSGWSAQKRLAFAFGGGVVMGIAARMARGCTSGQALSGGAVLSAGSWAFMLMVFAGGYAVAYFVRRQWS
ncbi:MAG: YeeE/YedE family protein [Deltaproteobacteria bacterium]|nr:YeeE/YedE family protein [Deltaproteobacteria bacterium]